MKLFGGVARSIAKPFEVLAGAVDDSIARKVAQSIARKGALLLAAYCVQQGWLEANHVEEFVGYAVGLVSLFSGVRNAINHG